MKEINNKKQLFLILLFPLGIMLTFISRKHPYFMEKFYSCFLYKIIAHILNTITGFLPFSLAELLIVLFILIMLWYIIKTLSNMFKNKKDVLKLIKNFTLNIIAICAIIYFSFQVLWGFNYERLKVSEIFNLNVKESSDDELINLCDSLIIRTNTLRKDVHENSNKVMEFPYEKKHILKIAQLGYDKASEMYPKIKGHYGTPKGVLFSEFMCYTGMSGFYFPFTGEANINMLEPDAFIPFTVLHEMAHQRGFARENEANYISYIGCINHPDKYFQYSGTIGALHYTLNAIYKLNPSLYKKMITKCSSGVKNDLNNNYAFWDKYEGHIEKISNKLNDTYLKSHNQKSGVKSYGEMVDLLLADYRKNVK